MKFLSKMKRPGATVAGVFSLALVSVVLLCGAGSLPVENFAPQGPMQTDLNAGGHNLTNVATLSATNLVVSGTLTAPNLGTAATNAASAFAPAAGPFPWADVTGAPAIQAPITLTTSGTSGAATLSSGTLNIPQYAGGSGTFTGTFTGNGAALTALHGYETQNFSGASTNTLTVLGRVSQDNVTLNAGSGVYTVNEVLSATGAQAGDVWEVVTAYPASLNPTINFNDGASSGTLTTGSQTLANSGTTTLQFFFNGTNWIHAAKGALLTRNLNSAAQADLAVAPNNPGGLLTMGGGVAGNGDAAYLPQFLAKLNKVRAGAATNVKVLLIGDSTTAGYGATSNTNFAGDKALSPSFLVANRLAAAGIPAYDAGWYGLGNNGATTSTLTLYDPRVTYGAGWTQFFNSNCLGGGFMESSNSTDTLTFSPGFLYNTIEVYYVINPGNGSIAINNGGSSLGTINTAGTATIGKQTYSVSLTNSPVNIQATSTTVTYIAGMICYNTNTPGVLFINAGMGNATTGSLLGTGWQAQGSITALAPDLSIVNLMINDCNNGVVSSGTYQSNLSSIVTYCQNYGSVMLVTPVPAGSTTYLSKASAFLAATKAVAVSDNTALVDVSSLMPSYSLQNTLGLRFDTLHPNAAGYQYYSSLLANEFLQICAPTATTQVTQTTVSGSTAGSAVFSEPDQGAAYKKVIIQLGSSLSGTSSYTFPAAFANTPVVVNSDAAVTSLSTTGVTVTGTLTLPRTVVLEGY